MYSLLVNYSTPSKFSQIAQKLGIPEPPKKPVNGFLRFKQENKALQQAGQSQRDFFAFIGSKWRSLSAEQKNEYNKEWETEIVSKHKHIFPPFFPFTVCLCVSNLSIGGI